MKKINWKKGGGELMGFALVLPMIMLVFCAIIMAAQLGIARQAMEYATYSACRAAAVSETKEQAQLAAERVIADMADSIPGAKTDSAEVVIENYTSTNWEKGNLVKCTVRITVDTISPWSKSDLNASITMMIERPASL